MLVLETRKVFKTTVESNIIVRRSKICLVKLQNILGNVYLLGSFSLFLIKFKTLE